MEEVARRGEMKRKENKGEGDNWRIKVEGCGGVTKVVVDCIKNTDGGQCKKNQGVVKQGMRLGLGHQ